MEGGGWGGGGEWVDEFVGSVSKMAVAAVTVLVYLIPVSVFQTPSSS